MRSAPGRRAAQPALPADVLRAGHAPPGEPHARRGARASARRSSLVGSRYAYRERLVRELADYPLRVWGGGWRAADDPAVRALVAGGPVFGRDKLCVYAALDAVAEPAPSDERHRRREHPRLRAGRRRRLPGGRLQGGPGHAVQAGRGGPRLPRPRRARRHARLLPGPPRRGARPSATTRAAARWPSTRCATASRRSSPSWIGASASASPLSPRRSCAPREAARRPAADKSGRRDRQK